MKIRSKIILTVLPLLISTLLVSGIISTFSARSGMTRLAIRFMGFKAEELRKYIDSQWNLLVINDLSEKLAYVAATQRSVESYAKTIVRSSTEVIFAVDTNAELVMSTGTTELGEAEKDGLLKLVNSRKSGWIDLYLGNSERVGQAFFFSPFDWYFVVSEEKNNFYREIRVMMIQSGVILTFSSIVSVVLLLIFSAYLAHPLKRVVATMKDIISDNDLSKRVTVEYPDEIGGLAHEFNIMTNELEGAYNEVKNFAIKEAVAGKKVVQREYETLTVLGKAAEFKNPETGAHISRIGFYSRLLAQSLGEGDGSQDLIFYASPLHDIGKIGIPDSILAKSGKLTPEEFEIIKTHPRIAYDILKNTKSPYLQAGATIALTHHEKYNGTGYPNALKGEDIPLYGRIVGLVDVFDALASKRPYKEPWPFEKIIDFLISEKGGHFNPLIVDHFIANMDEVKHIFSSYQEE